MRQAKLMTRWIGMSGFCVTALIVTACAGSGGGATSFTSPAATSGSTSPVMATAAGGVDGPLLALKRAVANCGNQGDVLDVLQVVFAGAGHSPAIQLLGDNGSVLTFRLGATVFQVFYIDSNGDGHLSCGDTVTGATP